MISTRKELQMYLDADKFALGKNTKCVLFSRDLVWHFEVCLRKYEYYSNNRSLLSFPIRVFWGYRLKKLSYKLGFSVPINCFGPGLRINHFGLIIVNSKCRIGKWCDIHQGTNIGDSGKLGEVPAVPVIGNYCYIGPGAKIFGSIIIGNEVRIGANSIVNKNVPSQTTAYGCPMTIHENQHKLKAIADKDFEQEFLNKYPQYKGMI